MTRGDEIILKSEYRDYLINKCHLSYRTATYYTYCLNKLSKMLSDNHIIEGSIYDICSIHELLNLKTYIRTLDIFKKLNRKCCTDVTPSLRHYYDYAVQSNKFSHNSRTGIKVPFIHG